jgi:hypothetical protein
MARSATWTSDNAAAVTVSDTAVLPDVTRALYVGTSGDVKVRMASGVDCTFTAVSGILPIQVDMVYDTGTDADGIVALY